MIKSEWSVKPEEVTVDTLPDGRLWVVLHKDIQQAETEDGGQVWTCSEVQFALDGREETVETIKAAFDDWWEYGEGQEAAQEPTVEDRLATLEAAVLSMMLGA